MVIQIKIIQIRIGILLLDVIVIICSPIKQMFEDVIYLCHTKKVFEHKFAIILPRLFVMTSNKPRGTVSYK